MDILKFNELSTGNLLMNISDEPETLIVDLIDSVEETINANGLEGIKIEDVLPIPLTEEWLIKMGFEKSSTQLVEAVGYEIGEFILHCYADNRGIRWDMNILDDGFEVKYIHQLQNLHDVLTGKELEIKG